MQRFKRAFEKLGSSSVEATLNRKICGFSVSGYLLGSAVVAYTLVFSYFTIAKHFAFRSYAWDLGIFSQAFWTTLHDGKLFYSTIETLIVHSGSFFGTHFSPILFVVMPVYAIFPTPQTLLVVQSFVLALGAIPLYLLSMHALKRRSVGLLFAAFYLMYPPLQGINWFDFHAQAFLPLFFLSAFYFFEKERWKSFLLFATLALMCEEHAALAIAFVGVYAVLKHRTAIISAAKKGDFRNSKILVSLGTTIGAVLWYAMTVWIRGVFFPVNPIFASTFKASSNWAVLGSSDPLLIPLHAALNPGRAVIALSYDFPTKIGYLIALFGPLAFRPLFKIRYLVPTIPWFVYSLLSNYPPYYLILHQYPAYVVPFIFAAAVYAVNDAARLGYRSLGKVMVLILACSVVSFVFASPLSPVVASLYPESGVKSISEHERLIHQILAYVPSDASILTHNNLFPHISSRINAYATPTIGPIWDGNPSECRRFTDETMGKVDYILVDIKSDPFACGVVFSLMEETHGFKTFVMADGVILFKKNYAGSAVILAPYSLRYDYTNLSLYSGEIASSQESASSYVLHFNGTHGYSPMFWHGSRNLLPPGHYSVTMRLRINGTGELFTASICSANGQKILAARVFTASSYARKVSWSNHTLTLVLDKPLADFELRTTNLSAEADIYLDYIDVKQVGP